MTAGPRFAAAAVPTRAFSLVRRGYSPTEVTEFLRLLATHDPEVPVDAWEDPRRDAERAAQDLVAAAHDQAAALVAAEREVEPVGGRDALALRRWLSSTDAALEQGVAFGRSPDEWAAEVLDAARVQARTLLTEARARAEPLLARDEVATRQAHQGALVEVAEAQAATMRAQAAARADALLAAATAEAETVREAASEDARRTRAEADAMVEALRRAAEAELAEATAEREESERQAQALRDDAAAAAERTRLRARAAVRSSVVEDLARARHDLEALQRDELATEAALRRVHDLLRQAVPEPVSRDAPSASRP